MRKILFTLVFSSAFGTVFAQNLLINGSFETESGTAHFDVLSSTYAPDGWSFTPSDHASNSEAESSPNYLAQDGKWDIAFAASGDPSNSNPAQSSYDSLAQSVTTVVGATYDLSYYLKDPDGGGVVFNATWDGQVIPGTQESLNVPGKWTLYSATVAGTGSDTLGLNGYDGGNYGLLDNVTLVQAQAVPEPKSLLTIGVGIMGLAILRRRSA